MKELKAKWVMRSINLILATFGISGGHILCAALFSIAGDTKRADEHMRKALWMLDTTVSVIWTARPRNPVVGGTPVIVTNLGMRNS